MKNSKDISMRGSFTVEAALVMPIIFFAIFALIYLSFYLHDMCRIQGMLDKTLHKAGITLKHGADIETGEVSYQNINDRGVFYLAFGSNKEDEVQIQKYLQQELTNGLFLSKIAAVNVEVGKFELTINVEADTKISLTGIKQFFNPLIHKKITGEYPIHNPAETIRRCEVILDTGSKIKGVDELKDKLEGAFGSE